MIQRLIYAYFLGARPKTLLVSIAPIILGLTYTYFATKTLNLYIATLTLLCGILLQIISNLANDYFDFKNGIDSEERLGPPRITQSKIVSIKSVRNFIIITLLAAIGLGIILMNHGGLPIILIGVISIVTALLYSTGPFPLSHIALGESLALIFFGPVALWGTYYLQTGRYDLFPALLGIAPGLLSAALMGINNYRDREQDQSKGKKTLATIFGDRIMSYSILAMIDSANLIAIILCFYYKTVLFLLPAISSLFFLRSWLILFRMEKGAHLNLVLANCARLNVFYCLMMSVSYMLFLNK